MLMRLQRYVLFEVLKVLLLAVSGVSGIILVMSQDGHAFQNIDRSRQDDLFDGTFLYDDRVNRPVGPVQIMGYEIITC